VGAGRELKWALERFWRGDDPGAAGLRATAAELRARHWALQRDHGIEIVASNDFSLYDQVLDMAVALGATPARFGPAPAGDAADPGRLSWYFSMARGGDVPALELTKWFDTNYHYLVPELEPDQQFSCHAHKPVSELREAAALGIMTRPVLIGPLTFLRLSKRTDGGEPLELLDALLPVYCELVATLVEAGAGALQIDEPVLVQDLDDAACVALARAFDAIREAAGSAELTVATYFGDLGPNTAVALSLPVDVVHVDLVRGRGQLPSVLSQLPTGMGLSLGVVDGRNVWRSDLAAVLREIEPAVQNLDERRLRLAPSCSLLHLPVDTTGEVGIDHELRSWLAFAVQRLDELAVLARALDGDTDAKAHVETSARVVAEKASSPRVRRPEVRARAAALTAADAGRSSPYPVRRAAQRELLDLPPLPTTTIGSFPQTPAVRQVRAKYRAGHVDRAGYEAAIEAEIAACVARQEELGLDVLVHGEFERTDMVEYFGTQLDGFATTGNGWVQSFGSRCVKPPVLFGDVARPEPMTVRWATFAAGLTDRPMKGMLTGPVTILQWSFVRDDQPESATARQVALALRDEVSDLEAAGIRVIQVDEPALREGLPLRRAERDAYLAWATEAFRIVAGGAADHTQIHTHMCYAEFGDILQAIVDLDADVISMEASRSSMELLDEFRERGYPNEIGPGIWDIHSPRVPEAGELDELLDRAAATFDVDRLWVNPDCGLKTRAWPEVDASLRELVAAAGRARAHLAS
jgi:5-methyltetrahydropteroyltriglutamate--homocysteine methyltransferase